MCKELTASELFEEIKGIKDEKVRHYAMKNYCIAMRNRIKELVEERVDNLHTISLNKLENEVNEIMEMADNVDKLNEIIEKYYGGDIDE